MAGGAPSGDGAPGGVLDLLALASARPGEALTEARAVLAGRPTPYEASVAHQAIGMLLREFGDLDAALAELRAALRQARRAGSGDREADVLAALGVALIYRGRSGRGLAALSTSLALVSGPAAARVLVRRGIALWVLGRHREALDDLGRAVRTLRPAGDSLWEARALTARALVHLACGSAHRSEQDLARAEHLYGATSQQVEVAYTWHNRGLVAFRSGDLPAALSFLDEAARRYSALAVAMPDLAIDRCAVLLAAGLPADALRETDAAVGRFPRRGGQATKRAELLLSAAGAALAAGEPGLAAARALAARRMFAAQGRRWWQAHARLLLLQAQFAARPASGRLLSHGEQLAADLDRAGSADAAQARLLAGRLAHALGRAADADRHFTAAAQVRYHRAPALARTQGWLAEALRAQAAGDRRRLLAACRRGLAILDEHQLTLGASELRAQATAHGAELAVLAQRAALASGRPRLLLAWSERWRATAHAIPPARPADDAALAAGLTALRDVIGRLDLARSRGDPTAVLEREQLRLEAAVRARVLSSRRRGPGHGGHGSGAPADRGHGSGGPGSGRGPGGGGDRSVDDRSVDDRSVDDRGVDDRGGPGGGHDRGGGWRFGVAQLLDRLGDATLVQIVAIDGDLHILVCGSGRVRRWAAGRADDAAREVGFARFGLRRLAHGRGAPHGAAPHGTAPHGAGQHGAGRHRGNQNGADLHGDGQHEAGQHGDGQHEAGLRGAGLRGAGLRGAGLRGDSLAPLEASGRRLDAVLLGQAARHLGDGPVIVVPPGRLHAVPWALLPSLRDRVVTVAPSARAWLQASATAPPDRDDPVFISGPGLGTCGEVPALAAEYPKATVLGSGTATARAVLGALDGAALAHIAAHGTFRADSPLFSSLRMDDGPLTVHDLERLRRAPYRVILPSCDSGVLAPAGADELLGLAHTLAPLGTAGIVASVVPVNDQATATLMISLHRHLRRGASLAEALRDARNSVGASGGDPVLAATAWSFISLGAA